jgi:hypothetical protein
LRKRRISDRVKAHLETLLTENVEHIRYSLLQSIDDTFYSFNSEMDKWIEEAAHATQDAVKWALEKRTQKIEEDSNEIIALESTHKDLMNLLAEFEDMGKQSGIS